MKNHLAILTLLSLTLNTFKMPSVLAASANIRAGQEQRLESQETLGKLIAAFQARVKNYNFDAAGKVLLQKLSNELGGQSCLTRMEKEYAAIEEEQGKAAREKIEATLKADLQAKYLKGAVDFKACIPKIDFIGNQEANNLSTLVKTIPSCKQANSVEKLQKCIDDYFTKAERLCQNLFLKPVATVFKSCYRNQLTKEKKSKIKKGSKGGAGRR